MKIKANNANAPMWKDVYTHSNLPKQLEPLKEMSTNLWWVWNHEGARRKSRSIVAEPFLQAHGRNPC